MKTIGEKYGPAMEIKNQIEADEYFKLCVEHTLSLRTITVSDAEAIERKNLAYYAGYYGHDTRLRVERLFRCAHPMFGPAKDGAPTTEQAFEMGMELGRRYRRSNFSITVMLK